MFRWAVLISNRSLTSCLAHSVASSLPFKRSKILLFYTDMLQVSRSILFLQSRSSTTGMHRPKQRNQLQLFVSRAKRANLLLLAVALMSLDQLLRVRAV